MPQYPDIPLTVTDAAGNVVFNISRIQFVGGTVSGGGKMAIVTIEDGGRALSVTDGATTVGNVGSIDFTSGATVTNLGSGAVGVSISGGGAPGILVETGVAEKISAMPTLTNPPPGPVYDAVITNDGTTTTNYQRPQGVIVQPAATGTNNGLGILLRAGNSGPDGGTPGSLNLYAGAISSPGTASQAFGGAVGLYSPQVTVTDPLGKGKSGSINLTSFGVVNSTVSSGSAGFEATGGYVYGITIAKGSDITFYAGSAQNASMTNIGGRLIFVAAYVTGDSATNTGGPNSIYGGAASGSGATNTGGAVYGVGGAASGGTLNTGGAATWEGGYGTDRGGLTRIQGGGAGGDGIGGNLQLGGGNGGTQGGIVLNPQPGTVDPGVLGELFEHSISTVGFVLVASQG